MMTPEITRLKIPNSAGISPPLVNSPAMPKMNPNASLAGNSMKIIVQPRFRLDLRLKNCSILEVSFFVVCGITKIPSKSSAASAPNCPRSR